jgi:hypothetical protein
MNEEPSCRAKDASVPEPPCDDSWKALTVALVGLAKASEAQTFHLSQLTEQLANLTERLASLVDLVESQNEDEDARFDTLS